MSRVTLPHINLGLALGLLKVTVGLMPMAVSVAGCGLQVELTQVGATTSVATAPAFTMDKSSGSVGSVITLAGRDFTGATSVTVGGTSALILSRSTTEMKAFVMPGSVTGNVAVLIGGTTYTSIGNLTIAASLTPQTQQGSKRVATGAIGGSQQGRGVSLSADGNTLAVGGPNDDSFVGGVWIFTRSGSTWTQQGSKLVGTGAVGAAFQGFSVSLSADGNTLASGSYWDNSSIGATWIFTRSGSTWTQQGSKLVGTGSVGQSHQGESVSLSADGNTLAVGGFGDNTMFGATWIFTRSGTTWSQQGAKLVGAGAVGATPLQGDGVSLSADGNTLAIGGTYDNAAAGATWIFTRSGTTWSQQGSKLVGTGASGAALQGQNVSLNADGNTLAVNGNEDNSTYGATWVFTRTGTTWTQQGSKLVGTGRVNTGSIIGGGVSLTADGNMLSFARQGDDGNLGATWIFVRSGTTWSQSGSKIIGSGYTGVPSQGEVVHLSADGSTLAIGGGEDNSNAGATWIFSP